MKYVFQGWIFRANILYNYLDSPTKFPLFREAQQLSNTYKSPIPIYTDGSPSNGCELSLQLTAIKDKSIEDRP